MSFGFHQRQNFAFHKLGIDSGNCVVLKTAFTPLRVPASVADRNGNHHRDLMLSNQGVHSRKKRQVRPVRPDDKRRDATRHVLLGNIDAHPPRVRSGVACSHHELCGVSRIYSSEGAGVTCNAWIDLAVRRVHSELHHRSLRYAVLDRHLGRNIVGRPDDEITVGICPRN